MKKKKPYDFILMTAVIVISLIGLVMVLSSSWPTGIVKYKDGAYFFKRQFVFFIMGTISMFILSNIDYKLYKKISLPIYIMTMTLGMLVVTPLGETNLGATRWIRLGPISFMPSDFMKLGTILFMAYFLNKNRRTIKEFTNGFAISMLILAIPCGIIAIFQKDLGTAATLGMTLFAMMFVGGTKIKYLLVTGLVGILAGIGLIIKEPYRLSRFLTFLDPFKIASDTGWQIIQSLYAIGSGGFFGVGLGQSNQKYFYLPESFSDFIFSIFAEETGFIGVFVLLMLYAIIAWRGIRVSLLADDLFGTYLSVGITALIILQALIHIAVVSSSIPTTGITLPFVSNGGSSLFVFMSSIGVLLNISRQTKSLDKIGG